MRLADNFLQSLQSPDTGRGYSGNALQVQLVYPDPEIRVVMLWRYKGKCGIPRFLLLYQNRKDRQKQ